MQVTVTLKHPPSGANKWQMSIIDDPGLRIMSWGGDDHGNIEETAAFELPSDWLFPLSIAITVFYEYMEYGGQWHAKQLYSAQSFRPYKWDFDLGAYGDEPDPTYRAVFIPDYGDYSYDVATEQFESISPGPASIEITAPDTAVEGKQVSVSAKVTNIGASSSSYKIELWAVQDIHAVPAPGERIGSLEVVIKGGQSQVASGSFTMPAWDTHVLVMVHRFINYWAFNNSASKVVTVEALVEGFAGSITKME